MKAAIVTLTDQGFKRALSLASLLPGEVRIYVHEHCASPVDVVQFGNKGSSGAQPAVQTFGRLKELLPTCWPGSTLLVFIMATGIVVRAMKGFIQTKDLDPAVLVGDETGRFIIPLLSGHLGGANAWANYLAAREGSTAVITTATDAHGYIAPDEYARRMKWKVVPLENLPAVNRKLLDHGALRYFSESELLPDHPLRRDANYLETSKLDADIIIGAFPELPGKVLYLVPPVLNIGVGCRRGVGADALMAAIEQAVALVGASPLAIKGLYSIDLKAQEEGLNETAVRLGVPFKTFKSSEIQAKNQEAGLKHSDFVRTKIGVDGVCEAASLLGTENGSLILPKIMFKGITVAISKERSLSSDLDPEIRNI